MIRRPPRSTLDRSSAASDVYKRQGGGSVGRGAGSSPGGSAVGSGVGGAAGELSQAGPEFVAWPGGFVVNGVWGATRSLGADGFGGGGTEREGWGGRGERSTPPSRTGVSRGWALWGGACWRWGTAAPCGGLPGPGRHRLGVRCPRGRSRGGCVGCYVGAHPPVGGTAGGQAGGKLVTIGLGGEGRGKSKRWRGRGGEDRQ